MAGDDRRGFRHPVALHDPDAQSLPPQGQVRVEVCSADGEELKCAAKTLVDAPEHADGAGNRQPSSEAVHALERTLFALFANLALDAVPKQL